MNRRKKGFICLLCALTVLFAAAIPAAAQEEEKETAAGQETTALTQEGTDAILPPTQKEYVAYHFKFWLPTCYGDGVYKLSKHYFDVEAQYGYPPTMLFSMSTSGICDFTAHVWARDFIGNYYDMSGSSYQSHGLTLKRTFNTMGTTLFAVNDAEHRSTAKVWDDIDYCVFDENITIDQK